MTYAYTVLKNPSNTKLNKFKKLVKLVIGLPLISLYSVIVNVLPLKLENLPFFPYIDNTW